VESFTVNVTSPLLSLTPDGDEIVEWVELPWARETVTPERGCGLGAWSSTVTVTVEVVVPSAGTVAGLAVTSELVADTARAWNVTWAVVARVTDPLVAV
jgi:hypothetical protein